MVCHAVNQARTSHIGIPKRGIDPELSIPLLRLVSNASRLSSPECREVPLTPLALLQNVPRLVGENPKLPALAPHCPIKSRDPLRSALSPLPNTLRCFLGVVFEMLSCFGGLVLHLFHRIFGIVFDVFHYLAPDLLGPGHGL